MQDYLKTTFHKMRKTHINDVSIKQEHVCQMMCKFLNKVV